MGRFSGLFGVAVAGALFNVSVCFGRVIEVPQDFATIQEAIDAAASGDVITVSPGIYRENLVIGGKAIELRSLMPRNRHCVESTVLDGGGVGSVITLPSDSSATTSLALSGFTVTMGRGYEGGGVAGGGKPVALEYNVFRNNGAVMSGGAAARCIGTIQNNRFESNGAGSYGGALYMCQGLIRGNTLQSNGVHDVDAFAFACGGAMYGCTGTIENNRILENTAVAVAIIIPPFRSAAGAAGGGITQCEGILRNNVFSGNTCGASAPEYRWFGPCGISGHDGPVENNTIADALTGQLHGSVCSNIIWPDAPGETATCDSPTTPNYCCIYGTDPRGVGNISTDPLYDPALPDLHVSASSPTIDAGDPDTEFDDACMPPGQGEARNDMGAYGGPGACGWRFVLHDDFITAFLHPESLPPEKWTVIDQNHDGATDIADLFRYWNQEP